MSSCLSHKSQADDCSSVCITDQSAIFGYDSGVRDVFFFPSVVHEAGN